jgi:3D (Asp-Asp-Asp) domain-containing protein
VLDHASVRALVLLLVTLVCSAAEGWQPVKVTATAYCPCAICCGVRAVGLTADGTDVRDWPYGIAVDPKRIAYGTQIYVPVGEGYLDAQSPNGRVFYADDTGGIIRRRTRATGVIHIDLRFRQHSSAQKFGVRRMTVFVWGLPP